MPDIMQPVVENFKYFLEDTPYYFIVNKDEYDSSVQRVKFYNGSLYLANERVMERTLEELHRDLRKRKTTS